MTLDEYQSQQDEDLNAPIFKKKAPAAATTTTGNKNKVLTLDGSGSTSAKKPETKEVETPKAEEKPEPKIEEKASEPKVEETKPEPKVEDKPEEKPEQPKAEETKPEPEAKTEEDKPSTSDSTSKQTADALVKEQEEELDQEIIEDLFGGDVSGKDHMSVIFMGHVDAGKSTMGGNILYLTGSVDKRTVEKYEREAKDAGRQGWYLSWVMDTNKEERAEGKTVEVGRAYFETEKRRYTILDAPGHKMYVPSMIGGASQADVGILVISARKGEYETGFEKVVRLVSTLFLLRHRVLTVLSLLSTRWTTLLSSGLRNVTMSAQVNLETF